MSDPLRQFLNSLRESQETLRRIEKMPASKGDTVVQSNDDPDITGRVVMRIAGPDKATIERIIAQQVDRVTEEGGFANFLGPFRTDKGYEARGEIMVVPA